MAPPPAVNTESEIARVHCRTDKNIEHPVYVHKHLLHGRALSPGVIHYAKRVTTSHSTRDQDDKNQNGSAIPPVQKSFRLDKLKNTKKTKHAVFFVKPFDPVAASAPTYLDIIKQPMDLSTIETKLKSDQYYSVQSFTEDIQLIAENARNFFGPQHAVSEAGNNMGAYVKSFISKVPRPKPTFAKAAAKAPLGTTEPWTISISLQSHRALVLWSRWLYGRPMWTQEDCANVDDDLAALASIYQPCAGSVLFDNAGRDLDALNACSDAIRQILLSEVHQVSNPLSALREQLDRPGSGIFAMLVDWLVYGECASNGKTKDWLHSVEGKHPDFFKTLSNEFAKKVMGENPPDLMARCAYHIHREGSTCDEIV